LGEVQPNPRPCLNVALHKITRPLNDNKVLFLQVRH
jgi:hypothetical protein